MSDLSLSTKGLDPPSVAARSRKRLSTYVVLALRVRSTAAASDSGLVPLGVVADLFHRLTYEPTPWPAQERGASAHHRPAHHRPARPPAALAIDSENDKPARLVAISMVGSSLTRKGGS